MGACAASESTRAPPAISLMLARAAALALCASLASADKYAVLVCGSNTYVNYRHHADVAHAYQQLTRGRYKAENIITMMYDDVPYDPQNPYPGQLYNKPAATLEEANEVYAAVKDHIDYRGGDVTAGNFLAVLTGDGEAAGGNRVLRTTKDDDVFVYYVDHGGITVIGMPNDNWIVEADLMAALDTMYQKQMYKQLVFYLETCHSGSMFENLPTDRNIYAVTAAAHTESSFAEYCDSPTVGDVQFTTCLGDQFSVNWLEHVDVTDLARGETLQQQYAYVRNLTESHVLQFGQLSIAAEPASRFEGTGATAPGTAVERAVGGKVDSRDVALLTRYNQYLAADAAARPAAAAALEAEIAAREAADATFAALAAELALPAAVNTSVAAVHRHCHRRGHEAVRAYCGGYTDYSLKHSRVAAAACNHWRGDTTYVVNTIRSVCAGH